MPSSMAADREQTRRDADQYALDRRDDFDRVEIIGRLRCVERGERTKLERHLQDALEQAERDLEGVHLALAEADVPRADGNDEPLYSEQHRVRLLRERAEQAEGVGTQAARELLLAEARLAKVPALVEALRTICDIGETRDVEVAEAALRGFEGQEQKLSEAEYREAVLGDALVAWESETESRATEREDTEATKGAGS